MKLFLVKSLTGRDVPFGMSFNVGLSFTTGESYAFSLFSLHSVALYFPEGFAAAQDGGSETDASLAIDLLDLANGAVVLSSTTEYDLGGWSALSVIDGTTQTVWA